MYTGRQWTAVAVAWLAIPALGAGGASPGGVSASPPVHGGGRSGDGNDNRRAEGQEGIRQAWKRFGWRREATRVTDRIVERASPCGAIDVRSTIRSVALVGLRRRPTRRITAS